MRKKFIIVGTILGLLFLVIVAPKKDNSQSPVFEEAAQTTEDFVYYYDSDSTGNYEIFKQDNKGDLLQLTNNPEFDSWWPRISPDEKTLLFYRTQKGTHDKDYSKTSLWRYDIASGKEAVLIANKANGWEQQGHAEWSPDGKRLVMFAGNKNPQIWTTNVDGSNPQQLTNEGGVNLDPSWSNDGTKIVYVGCPNSVCFPSNQEVYVLDLASGQRSRKTQDDIRDQDPYFSPDDSEIALLSQTDGVSIQKPVGVWDIRILRSGDGSVISQTNFGNITSLPTWSKDGKSIYTHQLIYGDDSGFDLVNIKPENMTSISKLLSQPKNQEYISF